MNDADSVTSEDLADVMRHAAEVCRHAAALLADTAGMTRRAVLCRMRTALADAQASLGVPDIGPELTERDRLMISLALRSFVARDIKRRDISKTYKPECLTVAGYDLIEFSDEMEACCSGDNVEMMQRIAATVSEAMNENGLGADAAAQDVIALDTDFAPGALCRIWDADPAEVDAARGER